MSLNVCLQERERFNNQTKQSNFFKLLFFALYTYQYSILFLINSIAGI